MRRHTPPSTASASLCVAAAGDAGVDGVDGGGAGGHRGKSKRQRVAKGHDGGA